MTTIDIDAIRIQLDAAVKANATYVSEYERMRDERNAARREIEQLRAELAETREHLALDRQAVITLREREQHTHAQLAAANHRADTAVS